MSVFPAGQHVPIVLQGWRSRHSPSQLNSLLQDCLLHDSHCHDTLRTCFVERVAFLRSEATRGQEVVSVDYSHTALDENGVTNGGEVRRTAHFERLRGHIQAGGNFFAAVGAKLREFVGLGTGNQDTVTIDERGALGPDFELVTSFKPAPGTLTIVDCVLAAHILTDRAPDCSTLRYSSMWHARMLFETLRRLAGAGPALDGPACRRAGRWFGLPLVNAEGRLLILERVPTMSNASGKALALLRAFLDPLGCPSGDAAVIHAAVLGECEDEEGLLVGVLDEVLRQVKVLRTGMWAIANDVAEGARQRIYDLENKIALQDVEIAQLSDKIKALTSLSKTIDASSGSDCRDETDTCGAPNSTIA